MKRLIALLLIISALAGCDKPEIKDDISLAAYPNPATERIAVYVKNEQRQACVIRIFDANAKQIAETKIEAGFPSDHITFDLNGFDTGTYHVVVEIGDITLIEKFYKV